MLELMVAGLVGIVVLGAGVAAFNLQNKLLRHSEKLLGVNTEARLGLDIMQTDLENAGYRFPLPAAAVFAYDNVELPLDNGTLPVAPDDGTNAQASVVKDTDVLDIWSGDPVETIQATAGHVIGFAVTTSTSGSDIIVTLQSGGMGIRPADYGLPVMIVNADYSYCVLQIQGSQDGPPSWSVTLQALPGTYPAFPGAQPIGSCIKPGTNGAEMPSLYIFNQRVRYMVYQGPKGADLGLYRETSTKGDYTSFGAPQLIVDGVEDLQVSWGLWNSPAAGTNPVGCGAAQPICWCNDVGSNCDGTALTPLIRAARVRITSRGYSNTADLDYTTGSFLPASFNHAAGPVDNITRVTLQTTFNFYNFPLAALTP